MVGFKRTYLGNVLSEGLVPSYGGLGLRACMVPGVGFTAQGSGFRFLRVWGSGDSGSGSSQSFVVFSGWYGGGDTLDPTLNPRPRLGQSHMCLQALCPEASEDLNPAQS